MKTQNQQISLPILQEKKVLLFIKREDLIHPFISGNKFRKLKYNLLEAKKKGHDTLLTYGGAFSNHIAATAYAGREAKMRTIGVIRGEELRTKWHENPTLAFAGRQGMQFHFLSREAYREKTTSGELQKLEALFGRFYELPEGGSNSLAVKGCEEMLTSRDFQFDVVCAAVGTGTTLAGISNAASSEQSVLGFPSLKGDFLKEDIRKFAFKGNWNLQTEYHFGGYAKVTRELIEFMNRFKQETQVPLDPVYTGKLLYGILDMVKKDRFKPNSSLLAIHTGGLQGRIGMNMKLKKKNLPLIQL